MRKRSATVFLQGVTVIVGLGVLALMLWFPHIEGRNADATAFEVYFKDPFLAYACVGSIAFFTALFQAFKLLGYAGQNRIFSEPAVKALRTIKRCGLALILFVIGALIFILSNTEEDRAGGVVLCALVTLGATVAATAAAVLERILQKAVEMKSEVDLTV